MPDTESKSAAHFATLPFRANQQTPNERLLGSFLPAMHLHWPKALNSAHNDEL